MGGNITETRSRLSAAERAYEHTKRLIIRGDLAGGTSVSEVAICDELGISRTPAHEAFLRLASEGLLTLESRKGAIVRPMSPSESLDVLEMREAIESASAARIVREHRQDDVVPYLRTLLDAQQSALANGDIDAFVEADDDVHTAVVVASRNPVAVQFIRVLRDRQQRLRHQLMRVQPAQLVAALDDHRGLVDAVRRGDALEYAALLHSHIAKHQGSL
ncbi:GntR family transcriptional regulator [soil metagenome]